jgi:hypothetical protein
MYLEPSKERIYTKLLVHAGFTPLTTVLAYHDVLIVYLVYLHSYAKNELF